MPTKTYAICSACKQEMKPGTGCSVTHYKEPDGESYPRIRNNHDRVCGDCNAGPGQYHHPGCDMERCPHCGSGQSIGCYCEKSQEMEKISEEQEDDED